MMFVCCMAKVNRTNGHGGTIFYSVCVCVGGGAGVCVCLCVCTCVRVLPHVYTCGNTIFCPTEYLIGILHYCIECKLQVNV